MTDANVAVNFSASTGDLESGIAGAREALAGLAAPIAEINDKYAALGAALAESHAKAAQAIRSGDDAAYADALRAAQESISGQIKAEQDGLRDRLSAYADDTRNHRMSEQEKVDASRGAVEQTYAAELTLMERRRDLATQSLAQRKWLDEQIAQLERNEQRQTAQLTQESLDDLTKQYEKYGSSVSTAFNGQLRGLLAGTQSWSEALKRTLGGVIVSAIEGGEKMAVQWLAAEATKTSATASGVASRTGAEQGGAAASLALHGSTIVSSILSSAAEAFAGVFGFLAPIMGPLAAGPAAAAQATVASVAGSVASADIGMWSVPGDMLTLVHHNELIMPAAEAGAFRNMLGDQTGGGSSSGNVSIAPTTHFHVNALDGASVSQWMRSNSSEMLRAVDQAVRHGAHLGLKRVAGI
jgi:small-conductance mechanosensitive channel